MGTMGACLGLVIVLGAAASDAGQLAREPKPASAAAATPSTAAGPSTTTAPSSAVAAAPAPPPTTDETGTIRGKNLWETFTHGGPLMIPILICSLVGMAFAIERFVSLRRSAVAPRDLEPKVLETLEEGSADEALILCERKPSALSQVLAAGLALAGGARDDIVAAMEETAERELWHLQRFARPLSVIAGVAPLLGLLGTVWGMILAFDVVAQKGALGDPKALAGGIATALLTTLAGLTVAIPAYVLYHYFRSRSDRLIIEIEETAAHVAAALYGSPAHANPTGPRGERGAAPDAAH